MGTGSLGPGRKRAEAGRTWAPVGEDWPQPLLGSVEVPAGPASLPGVRSCAHLQAWPSHTLYKWHTVGDNCVPHGLRWGGERWAVMFADQKMPLGAVIEHHCMQLSQLLGPRMWRLGDVQGQLGTLWHCLWVLPHSSVP